MAILLDVSGWPLLALETAKRSYTDAEETFYRTGLLRALSAQAAAEVSLGRYRAGLELALQGLKISETMQFSFLVGDLHGVAASAYLAMGNLDGCWDQVHQAIQNVSASTIDKRSFTFLEEAMHNLLGQMFSFLGAPEQAIQMYQQGDQTRIENFHVLDQQIQLGTTQALLGNAQASLTAIEQVIQYTTQKELVSICLRAQLAKASILIASNHACQEIIDQILNEAQRRCLPDVQIKATLLQARSAQQRGDTEEAANFAQIGAEAAGAIGHLSLEIEAYAFWLKAARQGKTNSQQMVSTRLQERLQKLTQQAQNPTVNHLLEQKIKAWTESFENN
jgi:tetratricopeptide (TPR) repeat protein